MTPTNSQCASLATTTQGVDEPEWRPTNEGLALDIVVGYIRNVASGYHIDTLRLSRLAYVRIGEALEKEEKRA